MENETRMKQDNPLAGLVGALLGSLIGVACIILLDRLGYVAAISGVVMAVCALKGYELLGGTLNRRGIIISSVIMAVMTFFGNQIGWAFAVSDALDLSFWEAYRALSPMLHEGMIEGGAYWGNLVLLYLFTLLGAVPTVRRHTLRNIELHFDEEQLENLDFSDMELFTADSSAVKRHARTVLVPLLGLVLFFVMVIVGSAMQNPVLAGSGTLVPLVMLVAIIVLAIRNQACTQANLWAYVRHNGRLWRINWTMLNSLKAFHFSRRNLRVLPWDKMPLEEQEAGRNAIFRAVALRELDPSDQRLAVLVTELGEVRPEKEKPLYWVTTCADAKGREHLWKIGKVYLDFNPDPMGEPLLEPCKPARASAWISVGIMVLVTVLGIVIALVSEPMPQSTPESMSGQSSSHQSGAPIPSQAPSLNGTPSEDGKMIYEHDGIRYKMNPDMTPGEPGVYASASGDTYLLVSSYPNLTEDDAEIWMELNIDEFCSDPQQVRYELESKDSEKVLVPVLADTDEAYLYNHAIIETEDGPVIHSALIYNPALQILVDVDVLDTGENEAAIEEMIHQIVDSLEVNPDAVLSPDQKKEALTEKNYQTFFAPAKDLGYELVGRAYFKGPADFYESFTDALLPFGDDLTYSPDGTRVTSRAHGMEVECFFVTDASTAEEAIKNITGAFEAANPAVSSGKKSGISWEKTLDVGIQQVAYMENDQPRLSLMYADKKNDGCYMCARITYVFEEMDDLTATVQTELSDAYAFALPPLTSTSDVMKA